MPLLKRSYIIAMILVVIATQKLAAQVEFTTWGNMTGVHVDCQLMAFETSAYIVNKDWSYINKT